MLRHVDPADTAVLIDIATATGLFVQAEAVSLFAGVLEALHTGALGEGHTAIAWAPHPADKPAGWCYFAPDDHAVGVWNLWWIGVDPSAQGTGGGDALLDAVETAARAGGGRLLIIETSATSPFARARAFYTRRRYQQCGCVPSFYGPDDNKLIFYKVL